MIITYSEQYYSVQGKAECLWATSNLTDPREITDIGEPSQYPPHDKNVVGVP